MLEYVLSGCSHARITYKEIIGNPKNLEKVKKMFGRMDTKYHKFSLLFNAYTEIDIGYTLKNNYFNSVYNIHSDSGGLQIVTRGKQIDQNMKQEIYKIQSNLSSIAMCFDKIPVSTTEQSSRVGSIKNRRYEKNKLIECARETGNNIKSQIEFFLNNPDNISKPFIIIQGNSLDCYKLWFDEILRTIPNEYYSYVGGISIGGPAIGTGDLEIIERAASGAFIDKPDEIPNNIHALGVGSLKRLKPFLLLHKNGSYGNAHLSYDSITQSSGFTFGTYMSKGKNCRELSLGSDYNGKEYKEIYNDIKNTFGDIFEFDFTIKELYYYISVNETNFKKLGLCFNKKLLIIIAFILTNIKNLMCSIELFYDNPFFNKKTSYLQTFSDVKNEDDFRKWYKHISRYVKSTRIKEKEGLINIDNFLI